MKSKTGAIDTLFAFEPLRRRQIAALQQEFYRQKYKQKRPLAPLVEAEVLIPVMQPIEENDEGYIAGLVRTHKEIDKRRQTKGPLPSADEKVIREMMENAAALGCARKKP
ncbi:MAG: hypothetical protein JXK05_08980 [Campylobacterales bacterium]|nr:hypothetical protein [Campylobacterales bacterium]